MANVEKKSLEAPDDTRTFDKGRVEVVNIGGGTVGRYNFEPGWKWSDHVKPLAGTELANQPISRTRVPAGYMSPWQTGVSSKSDRAMFRSYLQAMTPGWWALRR